MNNNLPNTMRAVEITTPGGPDVLKLATRPLPVLKAGEILIRVEYSGVNRPDCLQRAGNYAPPKDASDLPGLEVAGEVAVSNSPLHKVGDKVTALTAGGGYAEFVAVHGSHALKIPAGLSMLEAAALPENYFTVWVNLFKHGALKKGETLLIHGGSSGIGTTAIQIAKAFGATVIVTAGSQTKLDACLKLGADHAINYKSEDFVTRVKELGGADVILDMVGGSYINKNYQVANDCGRIVQIAFLESPKGDVDFRMLMMKRLVHTGSTLRPRSIEEKAEIAQALEKHVWGLLENKTIAPLIDHVFKLEEANLAHAMMEQSNHIGKIMLKI
jgi:NADPH:quinone reductase